MKGPESLLEPRRRAVERLLAVLPAATADEITPLLDARLPDPEGIVRTLLYEEERRTALARLGGGGDGGAGAAAPLLRRLLPFPDFEEARRIARDAWLRGRTDWLRFALGRMPGRARPRTLLPLRPDVAYPGEGFRGWHDFLWPERDPPGPPGEERWWSFESALTFVRSRGLLGQAEWNAFSRGDLAEYVGDRPRGIPGNPRRIYDEYAGSRNWLGTRHDRPIVSGYASLRKARTLVGRLGFASAAEWRDWLRGRCERDVSRPPNLPALPEVVYPDAWRGLRAWLGLPGGPSPESRGWRSFEAARDFARSLELADVSEWRAWRRRERPDLPPLPDDIPSNPDTVYLGCGFRGFGDWLGTDRVGSRERLWRPFPEAREFARSLGLSGEEEWREWLAGRLIGKPPCPPDVPTIPVRAYGNKWTSWGDFLGTANVHPSRRGFRPFAAARAFAHRLRLANTGDWRALTRGEVAGRELPGDIPANPDTYYDEWTDWGDFLGTGNVATTKRVYRSYEEARDYVRRFGISSPQWRALCRNELPGLRLPPDIPHSPDQVYRNDGWVDWTEFLGSHDRRTRPEQGWASFAAARRLVRSLGLARKQDYRDWLDGGRPDLPTPPDDLPRCPNRVYAQDRFVDWWDFLGRQPGEHKRRAVRPFASARAFARSLDLPGKEAWFDWTAGRRPGPTRPEDLPTNPQRAYRDDWRGWPDFLGKGR